MTSMKFTSKALSTTPQDSLPETPVHYVDSDENSTNGLKRSTRLEETSEKLEYNHNLSARYHTLCSEAYCNKLKMEHGIADLALLREVLKFVDARITILASTTPVSLASSTPRKVKRPRTQVPDGKVPRGMNIQKTRAPARRVNQVKNAKEPSMEVTTGSNLPKQRFSLYRADAPSPDPNPPTPFDLLLQHQDMAVPDCLQTSSTRMMSESSTSTTLAVQTPISRVKSSSPVIISDSEEEDDIVQVMPKKFDTKTPISPDVFQKLNAHRIKLSTSRGLLPDQILLRDTLIKLSERRLSDYTEFLRIVEDTSGIPVDNIEERRIYVEEKWTNYGVDFCRICIAFGRKEGILNL